MTEKKETISYSLSPEWQDVTPIPQQDDGKVLVPILYSEEYKEAMDFFRAIVKAEEYSERVLKLTEHIIRMNPAHYSVWQYRYRTLLEIAYPLDKELALINTMMERNLKTYQIWHHRRLLQTHLRDPFTELAFITKSLRPSRGGTEEENPCDDTGSAKTSEKKKVDTKNYHTWAYRQWLLAEFNSPELWAGELDFVDDMLHDDVRNNSAWHHRFFVVFESGIREGETDREAVARREIDYCKEKISLAPNNASPWNYLRGVLQKTQTSFLSLEPFVTPYTLASAPSSDEEIDLENPRPSPTAQLPCALAIEFLADINLEKAGAGNDDKEAIDRAVELFHSLATTHDTIRRKYWEYRQTQAKSAPTPSLTAA